MKKKSLILLLIFTVLVLLHYGVSYLDSIKGTINETDLFTKDGIHGSKDAKIKLKIVGLTNSKISKNFTTALVEKTKPLIDNLSIQIDLEFIGTLEGRKASEIIDDLQNQKKPVLLVFSPEVILSAESQVSVQKSKIPTILFSSDDDAVCENTKLSQNIWNFGLPLKSFSETYLSFVNQKYGQLAKDLDVFLYANDDKRLLKLVDYFEGVIKGLGQKVDGKLIVDDRQEDLYTTVRQVFDYDPRIIIGLMSRRGLQNFLKISSRLSLTFDMGVSVVEGAYEEDLIDSGENSRAIIVPSAYIYGANDSSGEYKITTSMYQGILVGGFLEKFFFRGFGENLTRENILELFEKLDGVRYEGLSGLVTFDSKTHGLIQPVHVGEFKNGRLNHVQYLGDVSLAESDMCKK